MSVPADFLRQAAEIVGPDHVLTRADALVPYARDEYALDDHARAPLAVLLPGSEIEVSRLLALCNTAGVPVTARGAGTGLSAGCVPSPGGVVLSLERLDAILELDRANATITVQAGLPLSALYPAVEAVGLYFPPHPGDESSFAGGAVATNAGGARAVKYGTVRRFVLGLQVVLADGTILELGGKLIKSSTGYHLLELMIGSEGTLGIITRVTFALLPRPGSIQTLVAPFTTARDAISAVPAILASGIVPCAVEFIESVAMRAVERKMDQVWPAAGGQASLMVILDGSSDEDVLEQASKLADIMAAHGVMDVLVAERKEQQARILAMRSMIYEALRPGTVEILDVCVPRSEVAAHLEHVDRLEALHGVTLPTYGHAADGNVHTHTLRTRLDDGVLGAELPDWRRKHELVREEIYRDALERGGVISGEHGIGLVKKDYLERNLGPATLLLMRGIRGVMDPKGILNPGKLF